MFPQIEGPVVEFYGWEVVGYYINNIINYFADYSWQIRVAYGLIVACILVMIVLLVLFFLMIKRTTRYKKEYARLEEMYREPFYQVLILTEPPAVSDLQDFFGCRIEELRRYDPRMFAQMISSLRMELSEVLYLPNIQFLCEITGVIEYFDKCLVSRKKIFEILQMVVNLNIKINEGELAIYLNHHNNNIRLMARLAYMICTENEPYKYLEDDLNQKLLPWRPMLTHRIFGWLQECGRPMPAFLTIAEGLLNEDSAAFLIEEVAYWGNDEEKSQLYKFYLSNRYCCRIAAMHATAQLARLDNETPLVESYDRQPENIKREVLKTVLSINSGTQVSFFEHVFNTSSSKETRETALSCLYLYGQAGRRQFEIIRAQNQLNDEHRLLLDQIDSANLLKQLREFSA